MKIDMGVREKKREKRGEARAGFRGGGINQEGLIELLCCDSKRTRGRERERCVGDVDCRFSI